ncbi:helicase [Hemileuca sp. nucleopolyhedrovirus]|uniref:Helicase n=1 Tax=Hemileuca sp. nucleopolyhedrovirus TaxID=1367203 RepID=S5MK48_9ABAC|nr:helicase [Hemileuca sp. nucleopolyhedrovirus]AGR56836.1 helicase [Hemileuca sp. nucleopolyhedrovirus]
MATAPMSVDQIFENIFDSSDHVDDSILEDFESVDNIILKRDTTLEKRIVKSLNNFQRLIHVLSNDRTESKTNDVCVNLHEQKIEQHDWSVQGNCFVITIRPFIESRHFDRIKDDVNFNRFFQSNRQDYGNRFKSAGDYVYWPNISISYFGWRQYLYMKFGIDIGEYVPLIHNKRLGNVNLFDFYPEFFLNVELSLTCNGKKLFVNGRTEFTDEHDDLFQVSMASGAIGTCKVADKLVYSNKNFLDYIRDDINLTEFRTSEKYRHFIRINLKSLRLFRNVPEIEMVSLEEKLTVSNLITASSENDDIKRHVKECITKINDHMLSVLTQHQVSEPNVLCVYLEQSKFVNFDYLLILVWRLMIKNDDFAFCETDIRFYLEILCETLYEPGTKEFDIVTRRCEPYTKVSTKVFISFCNHWTLFNQEDATESLACYFAIHYRIHAHLLETMVVENEEESWNYSFENVLNCGVSPEVMCKGFFKKIQSANACLVFNGKHYVSVKKDDDLYKLTEKTSPIAMSSVKFNNWKYLYFTDEGVYNLFINDYHSSTPFILGNTLMGALIKKSERIYLPENVINFMLDTGKIENDIYKIYHVAKLCRDVKILKSNMAMILAFDNCEHCKRTEQLKFNQVFREIWNFDDEELIAMGVYLNERKMSDLIVNMKCYQCQYRRVSKRCSCYNEINVDLKAFKVILILELLSNNEALIELAWTLLYSSALYTKILADSVKHTIHTVKNHYHIYKYASYFHSERKKIIDNLYNNINRTDNVDVLINEISDLDGFVVRLKHQLDYCDNYGDETGSTIDDDENNDHCQDRTDDLQCDNVTSSDLNKRNDISRVDDNCEIMDTHDIIKNDNINNVMRRMRVDVDDDVDNIVNFYKKYINILSLLKKWNVWWDKLIVARNNDDMNSWLVRFYTRVILSKMDLRQYSHFFIKNIVMGYLYFRNFTNFNYINSLLIMHFDASLGIPSDYEKCCIYCTGNPGSGKSSNTELMEHIFVVHKHDAETYTLSKKETDEMEANKLISQLYVINEMKECNDSFFKSTADSTKSNSVCRKYQGSQKYEANYKLMIINNKPLHISNYDKGVRNRCAIIYMQHEFEENLPFSGSVYSHIKSKKFPMEKTYYEGLIKPVRMFLSHILMYKRNKRDGYISYKNIIKHDPVHNHNLMCLDVNNSPINALIYILKVRVKMGAKLLDESNVEKLIETAAPYVETMIHSSMKLKRNASRVDQLCTDFKKRFIDYYRHDERAYYNLDMVLNKNNFNTSPPLFRC